MPFVVRVSSTTDFYVSPYNLSYDVVITCKLTGTYLQSFATVFPNLRYKESKVSNLCSEFCQKPIPEQRCVDTIYAYIQYTIRKQKTCSGSLFSKNY